MRPFRGRHGSYVASFNAAEVDLLADLIGQVRTLLGDRRDATPEDPLAGLTGLSVGPDTAPADPALARLLPDFHRDDAGLSAGLRMLREPEVIAAKDEAATTVLATLPDGGGTVTLDVTDARAWLVALNDLRLIFGVRLGITEEDDGEDSALPAANRAMMLTYRWLSVIQESLSTALLEALHDDR